MCHTYAYHSKTCNHRWLHLIRPCAAHMNFTTASPGHKMTRPTTLLGSTKWYPAPLSNCPDCGLKGKYDADKIRLYLGKGMKGERQGRMGLWGPYGNGYWPNQGGQGRWSGWNSGSGASGGGLYGGGQGYLPGNYAVRGNGGYGWGGGYRGRQAYSRPPGMCCFGF